MNTAEQPVNMRAAAWTAGVHAILLLLFIFVTYSAPTIEQPVQDLGMEVNLGTSDDGSGDEQPMHTDDPASGNTAATYKSTSGRASESKEILRTDEKDAPAINTSAKPAKNITNPETVTKRNKSNNQQSAQTTNAPAQRPRYVYSGGTGRGGNSATTNSPGSNEGNTTGPGDRGVPGGTPGAANYTGIPGSGNGISHSLSRRSIVAFPPPEADFREGGKVVIRVTVNRNGAIINKQVVSASNAELRTIALRKLDKVKFNKSEDAPEEQFGNITFVFKTRS